MRHQGSIPRFWRQTRACRVRISHFWRQTCGLRSSTRPPEAAAFGKAFSRQLDDPETRQRLGDAARRRVGREFLAPRQLIEQANLLGRLATNAAA